MIDIIKKYIAQGTLVHELKTRKLNKSGLFPNPNNAIWFFGDSHVFGIGVELEETAPWYLETLINKTVINYGVPGSGPMMVEYRLDKLLEKYQPLAVVIAWPSFNRWQFNTVLGFPLLWMPSCLDKNYAPGRIDHFGCKNVWPNEWEQYKTLVLSGQLEKDNLKLVNRVREKLKNYPLVEFQYISDSYTMKFPTPGYPFLDLGKDRLHNGPKTNSKIAKWVKDELQLLL
jgi:hypothetical protein